MRGFFTNGEQLERVGSRSPKRSSVPPKRSSLLSGVGVLTRFDRFFSNLIEKTAQSSFFPTIPASWSHSVRSLRYCDLTQIFRDYLIFKATTRPISHIHWRIAVRKWKAKFAHQEWWKLHGIQNRLAELHRSILSCFGPTIVQDSPSFRWSCVFCYTVKCTLRQSTGKHLLSALRLERYTAAIRGWDRAVLLSMNQDLKSAATETPFCWLHTLFKCSL